MAEYRRNGNPQDNEGFGRIGVQAACFDGTVEPNYNENSELEIRHATFRENH